MYYCYDVWEVIFSFYDPYLECFIKSDFIQDMYHSFWEDLEFYRERGSKRGIDFCCDAIMQLAMNS